jgi:creatinine amidohydrolase
MTTMPAFVLTHMSWPAVRSALESVRLAIILTGSCEHHSPNMTLETDAAICYALAERLAQRLYPHVLSRSMPDSLLSC